MKKLFIFIALFSFTILASTDSKAQNFSVQSYNLSASHEVVLYPNPVTENFFKVKSNDIVKQVEVINVIGQRIHQTKNESLSDADLLIHLNNCEKGMYLVKVTFEDDKSIIKKLLVK